MSTEVSERTGKLDAASIALAVIGVLCGLLTGLPRPTPNSPSWD
ncbi:hypothetical protein [Arthrobacter citreus]